MCYALHMLPPVPFQLCSSTLKRATSHQASATAAQQPDEGPKEAPCLPTYKPVSLQSSTHRFGLYPPLL